MKKINLLLTLFAAVVLLSSCEEYEDVNTSDLDLVYTNYSPSFDFKSQTKYSVPDSVVIIEDETDPTNATYSKNSEAIVNQIKANMDAYGWTEVPKEQADVIILPSLSKNMYVYYYYSWGYWGWYYPGYYPGWGWSYPGYYPGYYPTTASTYSTATLIMQMTYPKDSATSDNIPVVWLGVLNGLAEGTQAEVNARLQSAMNQAFVQSPYLKK